MLPDLVQIITISFQPPTGPIQDWSEAFILLKEAFANQIKPD